MTTPAPQPASFMKRLGWMVAIWAASVAALAAAALLFRLVMAAAGLTR